MQTNAGKLDVPTVAKPWYTHPWPWFLMFGPALVIVAGIHTTWLAFSRQDALVVDDYYKQGKAINQDLRRDRTAAALGMQVKMRYDAANGRLSGQLTGKALPASLAINLRLIHSTLPEKDLRLAVQTGADGRFEVALPILEQARWQVMLENSRGDWRLAGVWQWPLQRDIALTAQSS